MTDQTTNKSTEIPPLDMVDVQNSSMSLATARTISALIDAGNLDQRDLATARLAMEIAERIDADGLDVGISLYQRLWFCMRDLTRLDAEPPTMACPLAQQPMKPEAVKRE